MTATTNALSFRYRHSALDVEHGNGAGSWRPTLYLAHLASKEIPLGSGTNMLVAAFLVSSRSSGAYDAHRRRRIRRQVHCLHQVTQLLRTWLMPAVIVA